MLLAACLPGTGPALVLDDAGGGSIELGGDAGVPRSDVDLGDPFAIEGLTPSHGPFSGGNRVRIDGRGFSSKLTVYVGDVAVDTSAFLASDPTRAAIVVPPGKPGFVNVRIRDESTSAERILVDGYYYDPFVVTPDSGATSGGTQVAILGSGTNWGPGTTVAIGGVPCPNVVVASPTRLECVTPPGLPGARDVVVSARDPGESIQARDAFTYADGGDGNRGGLSGGVFAGRVRVIALDAYTGQPLAGAFVVTGTDVDGAKRTGATGSVEFDGLPGENVTVTVAAKCFGPLTFAAVPVDTVTAYLTPVLEPACIDDGDPSPFPGRQRYGGIIEGALVFPSAREFERSSWTTVPPPLLPTERQAAYVFEASGNPAARFQLPPAEAAITPSSAGESGYGYSLLVFPGNVTLYAIAGLEDRSVEPPRFVPYSMGVARGVGVPAQGRVTGVDIRMDVLFDHEVTIAARPPAPGSPGPDRFEASIATTLGPGYAILPLGTRTTPLPAPAEIRFSGVPGLDRAMAGEQYVIGARAGTGVSLAMPLSVVGRIRTTNSASPVALGGFLDVPIPIAPGADVWPGTHVEIGGLSDIADLTLTRVSSGNGLVDWVIVAPRGLAAFDVPDLTRLASGVALRRGAITTTMYTALIEGFAYGRLRNGHLASAAWSKYAARSVSGAF
jgi:hypothetical protein